MVSCIFTCTADLDAEFPAVAARRLGLSGVPLLCAREIDVPGSLPRVIRLMLHCYADPDMPARHVYLRDAEELRARPRGRAVSGIEFNRRPGVDPGVPGGGELRPRRRAGEAGLQRDALGAAAAGDGGDPGPARDAQPLSRTPTSRCCAGGSPSAPACRASGWRWATAPARSCWPRATPCSSPGPRWSTPGRRSRSTRTWRRSPGARAVTVPLDADGRHDLEAMAREVTAATRLVLVCNPNNPTATALPVDRDRRLRGRASPPPGGDPRRGLRGVLHPPGPRRLARPARAPPQPGAAAHLLQGLRPLRAARRLRARPRELPLRGGPRAPAVLGERDRPGGRRGGDPPPGRGGAPRGAHRDRARARGVRAGRARPGRAPRARPTSRGWRWATATRRRSCRAWPSWA